MTQVMNEWKAAPTSDVSADWAQTMERFVPLVTLDEKELVEKFDALSNQHHWKPSTTATYWGALLSAASRMGKRLQGPHVKAQSKKVRREAWRYEPEQSPPAFMEDIQQMKKEMNHLPGLALEVDFALAQRLGDTCKLQKRCVRVVSAEWVAVIFFEGKVVPVIGPYALHLPRESSVAQRLMERVNQLDNSDDLIFPRCQQEIADRLHAHALDIRSVRKGSLTTMALASAPLTTLLHFSKHASVSMLRKYLNFGAAMLQEAEKAKSFQMHLIQS